MLGTDMEYKNGTVTSSVSTTRRTIRRVAPVVAGVLVVVVIATSAAVYALFGSRDRVQYGIEPAVYNAANYTVVAPQSGVLADSVTYDAKARALSYRANQPIEMIVSQQPTPAEFTDIDGYATKFYNGLGQYSTVTTEYGQAHLTKPDGDRGANVAVINSGGSLTFISSNELKTDNQWQTIINGLRAIK